MRLENMQWTSQFTTAFANQIPSDVYIMYIYLNIYKWNEGDDIYFILEVW